MYILCVLVARPASRIVHRNDGGAPTQRWPPTYTSAYVSLFAAYTQRDISHKLAFHLAHPLSD